jgi:putative transposase
MTLYKNRYRIESARKPGWDYAANGAYFITICTQNRRYFFGNVRNGAMRLSIAGEIAEKIWWTIPDRFPGVRLDAFVVMPNHVHGILIIDRDPQNPGRDAINRVSTINRATHPIINPDDVTHPPSIAGGVTGHHNPMLSNDSVSKIIRWYKGRSKFEIGKPLPEFAWQPRFHDHVIALRSFAFVTISI